MEDNSVMKKLKGLIILNTLFIAFAAVFCFKYYNRNEANTSFGIEVSATPKIVYSSTSSYNNTPNYNRTPSYSETPSYSKTPSSDNTPIDNKTPITNKTPDVDKTVIAAKTPEVNMAASDNSDTGKDTTNKNGIIEKKGLVELIKLDDSFVIDIKYATTDNFTKKKIYTMPICLINKNTAQKLINANNEFKTLGYRIKVFDAYRPFSAQQVLYDAASDKSFVANPKKGSIHNRGAAVDVTLVDMDGNEIEMPSGYDEFSERAYLKYTDCDQKLIENRELLGKYMVKYGFKRISNEWWHFEDTNAKDYPLLDIPFEEFVQ
jgi:D-alanyl-D-alanine dipeptidase